MRRAGQARGAARGGLLPLGDAFQDFSGEGAGEALLVDFYRNDFFALQ